MAEMGNHQIAAKSNDGHWNWSKAIECMHPNYIHAVFVNKQIWPWCFTAAMLRQQACPKRKGKWHGGSTLNIKKKHIKHTQIEAPSWSTHCYCISFLQVGSWLSLLWFMNGTCRPWYLSWLIRSSFIWLSKSIVTLPPFRDFSLKVFFTLLGWNIQKGNKTWIEQQLSTLTKCIEKISKRKKTQKKKIRKKALHFPKFFNVFSDLIHMFFPLAHSTSLVFFLLSTLPTLTQPIQIWFPNQTPLLCDHQLILLHKML